MKVFAFASALAALSLSGCAGLSGHERYGSHATGPAPGSGRYEHQMHSMSEMRQKMAAAKTPEERRAMMAEHMKAMQGGMHMMCEMGSGTAPETMKRCMEMRDMTVRMMMEREGAARAP